MLNEHLIFLDLETTGASAARDRVTEVGLVEVNRGRVIGEWATLVNPGMSIPPMIQSLTGITCDARHRALGDARVLWQLTQCWHRELDAATIASAAELAA